MFRFAQSLLAVGLIALAGCGSITINDDARIIVYGDSMLAWNSASGRSAPDRLAKIIGEPIQNQSVVAAHFSNALNAFLDIRRQRRAGDWDLVIVNGGANDLFFECGCGPCSGVVNRLIAENGLSGEIPSFIKSLRLEGAQVVFVGYHRRRNLIGPAQGCADELDELDRRVERLAQIDEGFTFVSLSNVFTPGDASFYTFDRIHPSPRGSLAIARMMAEPVRAALARGRLGRGPADGG
ncbi:MAG: SGNH/GDSL hydrolase family protein [Pseudomonadota bacterium]